VRHISAWCSPALASLAIVGEVTGKLGLSHCRCLPFLLLACVRVGGWKLAGFGFSSPLDYAAAPGKLVYDYSDSDPTLLQQATQVWGVLVWCDSNPVRSEKAALAVTLHIPS